MRTLAVTQNITLDGVIDSEGGWFLPSVQGHIDEPDVVSALQEQAAASDAFLVGRVTFEQMRAYWPNQAEDTTGNTTHLNQVAKYVVSSTMTDPGWENSTVMSGPLVEEIESLKAQPGTDIVTTGSITLVHELIALDLVDEYRLFVYPVVLGRGRRLFEFAHDLPRMRLLGSQRFQSGVVLLRYAAQ